MLHSDGQEFAKKAAVATAAAEATAAEGNPLLNRESIAYTSVSSRFSCRFQHCVIACEKRQRGENEKFSCSSKGLSVLLASDDTCERHLVQERRHNEQGHGSEPTRSDERRDSLFFC